MSKTIKNNVSTSVHKDTFVFTKKNYTIMVIGLIIVALGYMLMVGGNGPDPTKYYPEIFDFQRLTLAPIVILLGLAVEIFAIFYRDDKE
jgi:hypothetical protein